MVNERLAKWGSKHSERPDNVSLDKSYVTQLMSSQ
jgi:hypothetical protein